MGPNNPNRIVQETNDLIHYNGEGEGVTSGSMTWDDGELGAKSFALVVQPYTNWEVAKQFVVMIYDIQGFPADIGSGELSPTAGQLLLTVSGIDSSTNIDSDAYIWVYKIE